MNLSRIKRVILNPALPHRAQRRLGTESKALYACAVRLSESVAPGGWAFTNGSGGNDEAEVGHGQMNFISPISDYLCPGAPRASKPLHSWKHPRDKI